MEQAKATRGQLILTFLFSWEEAGAAEHFSAACTSAFPEGAAARYF